MCGRIHSCIDYSTYNIYTFIRHPDGTQVIAFRRKYMHLRTHASGTHAIAESTKWKMRFHAFWSCVLRRGDAVNRAPLYLQLLVFGWYLRLRLWRRRIWVLWCFLQHLQPEPDCLAMLVKALILNSLRFSIQLSNIMEWRTPSIFNVWNSIHIRCLFIITWY